MLEWSGNTYIAKDGKAWTVEEVFMGVLSISCRNFYSEGNTLRSEAWGLVCLFGGRLVFCLSPHFNILCTSSVKQYYTLKITINLCDNVQFSIYFDYLFILIHFDVT